jgi:phosphoesterase RecJ-like protein
MKKDLKYSKVFFTKFIVLIILIIIKIFYDFYAILKVTIYHIRRFIMKSFDDYFIPMMEQDHLKDVVIIGHTNPDGDCAGSVMGLSHYIKTSFPNYQVYPYLDYNKMDPLLKKFISTDSVFKTFYQKPNLERYAIIVCDTGIIEKVEGRDLLERSCTSLTIDHHLCHPFSYTKVNYVREEESCCELICSLLSEELLKKNVEIERAIENNSPCAADYLYMGILHDTSRFTRASKLTLHTANQLVNMGVNHKHIVKESMKTLSLQSLIDQAKLLERVERRCNGKIAYLYINQKMINEENISYEEIHPLSNILRDCADIDIAFTMYEMTPNHWKFSFRSDESIDVNEFLADYGGGGHRNASSLIYETTEPELLREQLIHTLIVQNFS